MNRTPRLRTIEAGKIMVVTDLHGDGDLYKRYRDRFLTLQAEGKADTLVFNGDLIHFPGAETKDRSLEIILDVLHLKESLGDNLIYMLGNHEIPHIYSFPLQKGDDLFTPRFEWAMGSHRAEIVALFNALPFYLRTAGGVTITHAGASHAIYEPQGMERLLTYDHQQVLADARKEVTEEIRPYLLRTIIQKQGLSYDKLIKRNFAITNPNDLRYDDFLTATHVLNNSETFNLLWAALFTRNEKEYPAVTYKGILSDFLHLLSVGYKPQHVLVTGHINCPQNGYTVVNRQQLRIASGKHALTPQSGKYLLFNAQEKVHSAEDLLSKLYSLWG